MTNANTRTSRLLLAAAFVLALVGCGQSLRGKYESQGIMGNFVTFDFVDGDTVRISNMGLVVEGSYKIEGDEIKLTANGQTQILTLEKDGCFEFGPLGRFCKVDAAA